MEDKEKYTKATNQVEWFTPDLVIQSGTCYESMDHLHNKSSGTEQDGTRRMSHFTH